MRPGVGRARFPDRPTWQKPELGRTDGPSHPLNILSQDRKRDWAPGCFSPHLSPEPRGCHLLGTLVSWTEGEHWKLLTGSTGWWWDCRGSSARREPAVGLLQASGGMRGGRLLNHPCVFPLLSLQGTQSYSAGPWGQPPGEHTKRPGNATAILSSSLNPITYRWPLPGVICVSVCQGQPVGEPLAGSGPRPVWGRGLLRDCRSWGGGSEAPKSPWWPGTGGLCYMWPPSQEG